jgi:hypothetical protein
METKLMQNRPGTLSPAISRLVELLARQAYDNMRRVEVESTDKARKPSKEARP